MRKYEPVGFGPLHAPALMWNSPTRSLPEVEPDATVLWLLLPQPAASTTADDATTANTVGCVLSNRLRLTRCSSRPPGGAMPPRPLSVPSPAPLTGGLARRRRGTG